MISNRHGRAPLALSSVAAGLALIVASLSLRDLDVYRPLTPERLVPGAAGQDLLTVVASAILAASVAAIRRGRAKAWLVWVGLLGYLTYGYALYAFERLYTPYFLGYVGVLGLSVYALVLFFARVDVDRLVPAAAPPPPRRTTAIFLLGLVTLFVALWLSIVVPAMVTGSPPDGSAIFVLDLAFFLPLLAAEAVLLLRRRPLGDVLAVPILVKLVTLGTSVLLGTLLAPRFGMPLVAGDVAIYAVMGVAPLVLIVPFLRRVEVS